MLHAVHRQRIADPLAADSPGIGIPRAAALCAQEPQVVGVNAELFSRDKQNVPMLLSLLEEPPAGVDDFHVRYHALQILTGLSSSVHRLQEARPLLLHITCRQNTCRS